MIRRAPLGEQGSVLSSSSVIPPRAMHPAPERVCSASAPLQRLERPVGAGVLRRATAKDEMQGGAGRRSDRRDDPATSDAGSFEPSVGGGPWLAAKAPNARNGLSQRRRKKPELRQHFLNKCPLPQGHGSLRPSFSWSSLSPWTTRRPRLTWASLRIPPAALGHHLERSSRLRRTRGAWHTSSLSRTMLGDGGRAGTALFRPSTKRTRRTALRFGGRTFIQQIEPRDTTQSTPSPCSPNQRPRPASRAANASASVSGLSSSKSRPP